MYQIYKNTSNKPGLVARSLLSIPTMNNFYCENKDMKNYIKQDMAI